MDASLTDLLPRLFLSMSVVIGVMWFAARVMKNRRLPGMTGPMGKAQAKKNEIEVLGRQGLTKNATVTLVRTGGKTLVLGVTDAQVTLLTELVDETSAPALSIVPESSDTQWTGVANEQAWKGLLEQVRERTVRRA